MRKSPPGDFWVVVGLTLLLAVPAWLVLRTVQHPRPLVPVESNPTPWGYTWSLLLFLVPDLVIGWKILSLPHCPDAKKAFAWTLALLIPIGFCLDVFLGMRFFTFANQKATLGWNLPGYIPGHGFANAIPVEEFAFYGLGFIAILLMYVWADNVWLSAYSVGEGKAAPEKEVRNPRLRQAMRQTRELAQRAGRAFVSFPLSPVLLGGGLFFLALWVKRNGPAEYRAGIPGYFLFLLLVAVVPSIACLRIAARRINWRAFGFSLLFILLISQFWEASLGVPYQWWGYRKEQMMGIFFKAFCDLPIEAVLLWAVANWTTVLVYETIHLALHEQIRPFWRIVFITKGGLNKLFE